MQKIDIMICLKKIKIRHKKYAKNRSHNMSGEDKYKNLSEEDKNKRVCKNQIS